MKGGTDLHVLILVMALGPTAAPAEIWMPAFPGAEGFGAKTVGGRGGAVIEVTNLNDSGPGSFRAAVEASGPRTVILRVGGTIELQSTVLFTNPYITIAGQAAPGGGIAFKNTEFFNRYTDPSASFDIRTHDVIIRHVRIRPGSGPPGTTGSEVDCVQIYYGCYNIILDHCSMSWAVDENFSSWGDPHDFTIQWCLISEGLRNSVHSEGAHSMGALIGSEECERVSFHHNLLAHNVDRNPRLKTTGVVDCVNNVFYNHGDTIGLFSADYASMPVNYVGNSVKPGPSSSGNYEVAMWESGGRTCSVYVDGNIGPHRPDETVPNINVVDPADRSFVTSSRHHATPVCTTSAARAFSTVAAGVGATLPVPDSADQRVLADVLNGTGRMIDDPSQVGGWPVIAPGTPPADGDHDGMPDAWESAHSFDPSEPDDGPLDADGDGYTNLEECLNGTDPRVNPWCGVTFDAYAGTSPDGATLRTAAIGQRYRTDRAYTLMALPTELSCSVMVAYAEADGGDTVDEFIRLGLTADATVAVAYDAGATSIPTWLASWSSTGQTITGKKTGTGGGLVDFNIRAKTFIAGESAVLGGNRQGGGNAAAGYLVFILPECPRPVPQITRHPAPTLGRRGETASFSAQAVGAGALAYQWQRNGVDLLNGPRYSGVHTPTLTISDLELSDAGRYRLVVSDGGCSTASAEALLTLATPCDYDHDGDVDQGDFGHFQSCLGASGTNPICRNANLAGGVEVSAEDFAVFFQCFSGPNVPATDNCRGN